MQEDPILATCTDTILSSDEFNALNNCPQCNEELMFTPEEDVRFDAERASSPPGPVDLDQRCSASIRLKVCFGCDFRAIWAQVFVYAGY
jgi:hypothetical protein